MSDAAESSAPGLGRSLSIYLDAVRFIAALVVFVSHAALPSLTGGLLPRTILIELADAAVMAFFVLSGFVIPFAAQTRDRSLPGYASARLARLWSVALPALLVTVVADEVGRHLDPTPYAHLVAQRWGPAVQLVASALFVNEVWFLSIRPFSNGPYWSVGYEFWYYVLFGAVFYLRGRARLVAFAAGCAIAGPKILVLFPIWLMGVLAHRHRMRIGARAGTILFLGSIATALAIVMLHLSWRVYWWHDSGVVRLFGEGYSRHVPSKYVTGLLVACNLLGAAGLGSRVSLRSIERPVRWLAGATFSLYLFHYPLLHLFASVLPGDPAAPGRVATLIASTLVAVVLLAAATERRKERARRGVGAAGAWLLQHALRRSATAS